ncbi:hypothetical protein BDW02DRAFT_596883 [Decorospora gaudefroyi]|uniref:Uncharacterized protein n=1 Tax=Decorospora gaudefroyi TaxID=184978 RepID=A0A6A5KD36_9PLEO|nr:hypothetical protein BDW02DRAFT_596883 [Decorospora gaudefroyi]
MLAMKEREDRIKQRVELHRERIEGLITQVQTDKVQDTLAYHRRKIVFLRGRQRELSQEQAHSRRKASHEDNRQAPIRRNGTEATGAGSLQHNSISVAERHRGAALYNPPPPDVGRHTTTPIRPTPTRVSVHRAAEMNQMIYGHARLTQG